MPADPHLAESRLANGNPSAIGGSWDAWLESSPLGQFQQTTRWAQFKAIDGWQAERIFVDVHRPEAGGLQLLWKATRFGRIGYVSKGPVLPLETGPVITEVLKKLQATARGLGLRALILQPPDRSGIADLDLRPHHFSRNPVPSVIRATATIDLRSGRGAWEGRMHSKTRQQARAAIKRGVTVRSGGRADLALFFALMCESCRRQNTRPNPSRLEALEALWDAFNPRLRLGFASVDGEAIAGLLMIGHGDRLTFWKKGWNSRGAQLYANCHLMVEALDWGTQWGYATVDFAGLDHGIAQTLVGGGSLDEAQQRSRDMFNLRLGAQAQLIPGARLLVLNPVLRQLHRISSLFPPVEKRLMRSLGGG
jgi:lipid II:glycine glycyltransferase (peptidoglycan interpeptide bridge formation enzyme)